MTEPVYQVKDSKGVWIYLEHDGKTLEGVSLELLNEGKELSEICKEPLVGLILGHEVGSLAEEALRHGVNEVVVGDDPLLAQYTTDAYTQAATEIILSEKPNIFLLGATPNGRDLAGRLAVRLRTGLSADCTNFEIKKGKEGSLLLSEVTGFGGGIAAMIACEKHRPQMATVRPGVFEPSSPNGSEKKGKVRKFSVKIDPRKIRTEIVERKVGEGEVDITKAKYLVCGGRGVQGNFKIIRELAGLIGAEVGATRVAVDEGWVSKEHMVGQTGYVTRPKVALVFGISGALQFTVGIHKADIIVSVNEDPEAPIFQDSDYYVHADLFQILPPLIEEMKKVKSSEETTDHSLHKSRT